MIKIEDVTGIGEVFEISEKIDNKERKIYKVSNNDGKVFLVINKNTFEVRTDSELKKLLTEKYESVMESRYFGRGGIEVVDSGQLKNDEICDLVRLSYNMSKEAE